MNRRRRRLILWIGALALTLPLQIPGGHETPPPGADSVALLHGKPGTVTVRIAGDIQHPGLYRGTPPAVAREIIGQAAPPGRQSGAGKLLLYRPPADGDLVTITRKRGEKTEVAWGSIPARERIVAGIPLEPARMSAADWEALPGIGPALTGRIMTLGRQQGGLRSLDDLRGVEGIGPRTMERLRPLFK
jgi:competence protein ComEA